ncbi:MAG: sn-glycerol-3-phosphate transporter [Firmicutes bacterium]|nr:sn-glycerol-3-phosphate transporter [Bacillota bacterium]
MWNELLKSKLRIFSIDSAFGLRSALVATCLFASSAAVAAEPRQTIDINGEAVKYNLSTSLWTTHFNPRPEHNNTQRFLGIERYGDNFVTRPLQQRFERLAEADPMLGIAHFRNSFDQSTIYAYAGFTQAIWQRESWQARVKVSAGFIHGYRNEFQHKIPFNSFGTAPAAIPSLTLHYQRFNGEMILFGTSGVMLNVGYSF